MHMTRLNNKLDRQHLWKPTVRLIATEASDAPLRNEVGLVMKGLTLLVLLSMISGSSNAQTPDLTTTEAMLAMCKSNQADNYFGLCLGFVSGVAGVMEQVGLNANGVFRGAMGMCVSAPYPSANAEVEAFAKWGQKNRQMWGQPSIVGVMTALASTWRCSEQNPSAPP